MPHEGRRTYKKRWGGPCSPAALRDRWASGRPPRGEIWIVGGQVASAMSTADASSNAGTKLEAPDQDGQRTKLASSSKNASQSSAVMRFQPRGLNTKLRTASTIAFDPVRSTPPAKK